jgi:hypothetical protein
MASIKNFFVRGEGVKNQSAGLSSYIAYLESEEHRDHKQTKIVSFGISGKDFIRDVVADVAGSEHDRISSRKGGRPMESYAQSFVLSLPRGTPEPSKAEWLRVAAGVINDVASFIGVDAKKLKFFANVHNQDNPHLNIVFSKIVDGKNNRDMSRKAINVVIKNAFNREAIIQLDLNFNEYKPKKVHTGKRLNPYQLGQRRIADETAEITIDAAKKAAEIKEDALKKINRQSGRIITHIEKLIINPEDKNQLKRLDGAIKNLEKTRDQIPEEEISYYKMDEIEAILNKKLEGSGLPNRVKPRYRP